MNPLTVALRELDPQTSAQVRTVLSSMPARFRLVDAERADVVVLSGHSVGWSDQVAAGARAAFMVQPGAAPPAAVRDLAHDAATNGLLVAVDVGFAADRVWQTSVRDVRADISNSLIVDCFVTFDSAALAGGLIQQLALMRPLVQRFDQLAATRYTADQYVVTGRCGDTQVTFSGLLRRGAAGELQLAVVGRDSRWRVRIGGDGLARPSDVTRFDSQGAHSLPPVFESPHRAAWLELHKALTDGESLAYTLSDLADDLEMASVLLS
jgi:hypothetical protein